MAIIGIKKLLTLALAASYAVVSASPAALSKRGEVLIGYRGTTTAQAAQYEAAGNTLTYETKARSKQIGEGTYLASTNSAAYPGEMYCAVYADEAGFEALPRVWIPQSLENKSLGRPKLKKYSPIDKQVIEDMGWTIENAEPEKVMAVMKISHLEFKTTDPMQLCIPEEVMSHHGGPLKTRVVCKATREELGTTPVAESLWTHGAKGMAPA